MMNAMLSLEEYNFGEIQQRSSSTNESSETVEGANIGKESLFYGVDEDLGVFGRIDYGFPEDVLMEKGFHVSNYEQQEKQQSYLDYGPLDDLTLDTLSPPLQTCLEEIPKLDEIPMENQGVSEPKKEKKYQFSLASLELLKNYRHGQIDSEKIVEPSSDPLCTKAVSPKLSTQEIMKIAGERFIESYSQMADIASMLNNPFKLPFSGLTNEDAENVDLVEFLLASAEKVGNQQYECASRLLNQCDYLSSNTGNPVQRVVYYFAEALRERIDQEMGKSTSKGWRKRQSFDLDQAMISLNPAILACYLRIPFCNVACFAGIQAIVENVVGAKRIHIIDLQIGNGGQWTVLMQALVSQNECPLELLKISAIGTGFKQLIEDTGKRLVSLADSMSIPFSFKIIIVSDMLDLKEDLFELDDEETVAVYSGYSLRNLIVLPNRLDSIMKVFRDINPCVMVVAEVEANDNSPSFVNRFIEALFMYSAWFDCLDACMERDNPNRMTMESMYLRQGIVNIVATEGDERNIRHVKIDVWRAFFARFEMMEAALSTSSFYQAHLVLKKFNCWSSCTLDKNGRSLLIGWKGTPILSLSVWKYILGE